MATRILVIQNVALPIAVIRIVVTLILGTPYVAPNVALQFEARDAIHVVPILALTSALISVPNAGLQFEARAVTHVVRISVPTSALDAVIQFEVPDAAQLSVATRSRSLASPPALLDLDHAHDDSRAAAP